MIKIVLGILSIIAIALSLTVLPLSHRREFTPTRFRRITYTLIYSAWFVAGIFGLVRVLQ